MMEGEQRAQQQEERAQGQQQRPAPAGSGSWPGFWKAQGMLWRTEPEIDEERQHFLSERRAVQADIENSIYPFKNITLARADVEWLLATHESGGMRGSVVWDDVKQRQRQGLDVRGANLRGADVSALPLARTRAGLSEAEARVATVQQVQLAAVHLERANLRAAQLQGAALAWGRLDAADLTGADLTGANLFAAHLEGANLTAAQLAGANLENAFFDSATYLSHTQVSTREHGAFVVADVRWAGVNLARVAWGPVQALGDERRARERHTPEGRAKTRQQQLADAQSAVRANLQLALAFRSQGLSDLADRFTYRAQNLQRTVLRRQRRLGGYLFSLLLWTLAGYGYRLGRIFVAYAVLVLAFATIFFVLGIPNDPATTPQGHVLNALLVSVTAIHGRVFFEQFNFTPQAWVAAVESVFGIVIEGVFVAMLIQRLFAR